jgi:predicted dienelactone hydrolase
MNTIAKTTLCLLLTASLQAGAQATTQTVWRCGPDGRSYESQPCKDGRAIELPGARTPADVLAAQRVAEADRRLAQQLRDERLEREREQTARGPGLAGFGRAAPVADVKPRQDRQAASKSKPPTPKLTPSRLARSPEAGGTSAKAARASRQSPG